MSKARDLADFISTGSILSDGTIESTEINGVTADASELNVLDGITVTTEELNNVAGISTSVQTQLDGKQDVVTGVSDTEIGYLDGVTSNLQTQLDNISVTSGSLTKSFASGETASITLAQAISPAPVVSATKEVAQAGISSKGTWDVNATASNYELHNTAYDTTLTPGSVSVASDVSGSSYDSVSFSVASQQGDPQGCTFGDNGYKLYVAGKIPQAVHQYNLTTAYDISTASYASKVLDTSSYTSNTRTVVFKSDGSVAYVLDDANSQIDIYNLSTAWDISTASYSSNFSLSGEMGRGLAVKPDGTKFYFGGGRDVREYTLTTAWDLTTASLTHTAGSITISELAEIAISSDGNRLYILNRNNNNIEDYTLSTAYDLSTVSSQVSTFSTASQDGDEQGIMLNGDDSKIYMIGKTNDLIYQYTNATVSSQALILGTGSFASTDVGKRIQGNGGDVTLTSTAGAYDTTGGSAFTDTSTIASGSWSMRGLKSAGDADGIGLSGTSFFYDMGSASYDSVTFSVASQEGSPEDMAFSNDGTKLYMIGNNEGGVFQYSLSTAFDLSTISYDNVKFVTTSQIPQPEGLTISSDGTKMHILDKVYNNIYQYTLSTAFDVSTASYSNQNFGVSAQDSAPRGFKFSNDGTKLYVVGITNDTVFQYSLTGAFNIATASYANKSFEVRSQEASPEDLAFNSDGTKMYIVGRSSDTVFQYSLSTAFDVSTASYDSVSFSVGSQDTTPLGLSFNSDGSKMYMIGTTGDSIYQYSTINANLPTSQYNIGVTNSAGQINTAFWTDLNTMVADQAAGDGTVHYAVSTDDRTTWSVIKEGSGVRPIVRDNSGTWQYNSDAGTTVGGSLTNGSFVSEDTTTFSSKSVADAFWGDSGNHLFILNNSGDTVLKYSVSTAYDLSTINATPVQTFSVSAQEIYLTSMWFSPDGLHMYIGGNQGNDVNEYTLTSAWDLSTASFTRNTLSAGNVGAISLSSDGTIIHTYRYDSNSVGQATLSTAWNTSTAGSVSYYTLPSATYVGSVFWASNGYTLYVGDPSQDVIHKYTVSTAYDLSSTLTRTETLDVSAKTSVPSGMVFNSDLSKLYIMSSSNAYTYNTTQSSYGTSTTWTNATTNDEFYALQQALGYNAFNRMDKTQLDAVTDPNHYTLGDTLDLAIALRMDTASASTPTADGVTINYDAASLNQGAVLGTDYDYDFPDSTTVRVTSNAAQNLKIRVV